MIIEGAISIKGAIEANKRDIEEVLIDKDKRTKDFNYIRRICKDKNIQIKEVNRTEFEVFNVGKSFGGIIAKVGNRKSEDITNGDIFIIDGIEDPFNIGYISRTIYALGINNLILPLRDYSNMEAQILKSSAGAFEYLHVIYSDDLEKTIKLLKDKYTIYALKRSDDSIDIFNETFDDPCVIVLGGEKRGLSSNIEELCDKYLYIPYGNNYRNALNASSATAVVSTLLFSQRKK